MNNQTDDQQFEDPKLSALYRKGATEEPDTALDERILQHAQQARSRKRRMSLGIPLSAAAMLLLAVGIVRLVLQEAPLTQRLPAPVLEEAAPTQPEPEAKALGSSAKKEAVREKRRVGVLGGNEEADADVAAPPDAFEEQSLPRKTSRQPQPAAVAPSSRYRTFNAAPREEKEAEKRKAVSPQWDTKKLLAEIRTLIASGQTEAARKKLLELKKKYPQFPIPEDLAPLLREKK